MPMMSLETIGSVLYSRMPLSGPSEAVLMAPLTSSLVTVLLQHDGEVGHRAVGHGNPDREAGELAVELGDHLADGLGRAGLGGDHVDGRRAGPVHVLVDLVGNPLVVGVGVNRGHQALLDAEGLVQDLGHRGQAVGGAGRVGHDLHARLQDMIVDAQHEGRVELVLGRGAQDDPLGTRVDVLLKFLAAGEEARRLQRDLASQALPGEIGGVTLGEDGNRLAVDHQGLLGGLDSPREPPVDAVVLEQHRKVLRVREVVDRHDLELLGVLGQDAKDETPDSTKAVDTNTNCHDWTPGSLGEYTKISVKLIPEPVRSFPKSSISEACPRVAWPDPAWTGTSNRAFGNATGVFLDYLLTR